MHVPLLMILPVKDFVAVQTWEICFVGMSCILVESQIMFRLVRFGAKVTRESLRLSFRSLFNFGHLLCLLGIKVVHFDDMPGSGKEQNKSQVNLG